MSDAWVVYGVKAAAKPWIVVWRYCIAIGAYGFEDLTTDGPFMALRGACTYHTLVSLTLLTPVSFNISPTREVECNGRVKQ